MPKNLEKCVRDLIAQGHKESEAYAICTAATQPKKKPKPKPKK